MPQKKRKGRRPALSRRQTARNTQYSLTIKPSETERQFLAEVFRSGWARWFPVQVFEVVGAAWENPLGHNVDAFEELDLNVSLWESSHEDDADYILNRKTNVERFAEAAGLPVPNTVGELAPLLERFGVLQRDASGRYQATLPLPLIGETGVLNSDEVAEEDKLRWSDEFEPLLQRIIGIFVKDNRAIWRTSISEVAQILEVPAESARATLELLGAEADFQVEPSARAINPDDRLTITVDWAIFDANRISLGG
jgi:hypothetical protein